MASGRLCGTRGARLRRCPPTPPCRRRAATPTAPRAAARSTIAPPVTSIVGRDSLQVDVGGEPRAALERVAPQRSALAVPRRREIDHRLEAPRECVVDIALEVRWRESRRPESPRRVAAGTRLPGSRSGRSNCWSPCVCRTARRLRRRTGSSRGSRPGRRRRRDSSRSRRCTSRRPATDRSDTRRARSPCRAATPSRSCRCRAVRRTGCGNPGLIFCSSCQSCRAASWR